MLLQKPEIVPVFQPCSYHLYRDSNALEKTLSRCRNT